MRALGSEYLRSCFFTWKGKMQSCEKTSVQLHALWDSNGLTISIKKIMLIENLTFCFDENKINELKLHKFRTTRTTTTKKELKITSVTHEILLVYLLTVSVTPPFSS